MAKELTDKQLLALELLTSGKGMKYKDICAACEIDHKTLWRWRNEPEFAHFQERLKQINDERWLATVDAAREAALRLCNEGKTDMVKFVLQNEGFNPAQKIEADVSTDINIVIGGEDKHE